MTHLRLISIHFLAVLALLGAPMSQAWASPSDMDTSIPPLAEEASWPTVAANPQRTSWTAEEVRGKLYPVWYRVIEPYIPYNVQVIAANGLLYISTARGLYALKAENGDLAWVYPTEMPLGNSPTVFNGRAYVGGFDHKLHAIDALTGKGIWTYEATGDGLGAGFSTNPLVVEVDAETVIYAGNRDGTMLAVRDSGSQPTLSWQYRTDGSITFSAAYQDGAVYFASNDAHAYALDARTGRLLWKSAKLPGAGFHAYWPVVYRDWVIFAGSQNYLEDNALAMPDDTSLITQELRDIYTKNGLAFDYVGPVGTEPGDWAPGTRTVNAYRVSDYLESQPERRTYFVLNRSDGKEFTFDSDADGKAEYAPIPYAGTHSGVRYPPVVGVDGVLYQQTNYFGGDWIASGGVAGWKFGTQYLSEVEGNRNATDEPMAYAAGGRLIYWDLTCDREAGSFDITIPYGGGDREWSLFGYNELPGRIPGYDAMMGEANYLDDCSVYGSGNGVYGTHGVLRPPIPYRGMVYTHKSNAVIAFGPGQGTAVKLPRADTIAVQGPSPSFSTAALQARLAAEVQKIIDAGHLRPGYLGGSNSDMWLGFKAGYLGHYFHNPAENLYTLVRALPHLPADLQAKTREVLQQEFHDYPPYQIAHAGWSVGAPREVNSTLPEVQAVMKTFGPSGGIYNEFWGFPQYAFYYLWKYAEAFGGANEIFAAVRSRREPAPSESLLADYPFVHNAYIAGYLGYLRLEALAGQPESQNVKAELERLMRLRAETFSKDTPFGPDGWGTSYYELNISRNFIYMVPELADYLRANALAKVRDAIAEYDRIAPYWFVSRFEATVGEGAFHNLYDVPAVFQAKAMILREDRTQLAKYLDAPAFARGDLFYIQNLIALIEATSSGPDPSQTFTDVPVSHPYYREIEALYQAGYTAGCRVNPLMYCPDATMNRGESAVFVERGIHTASYDPPAPSTQVFADMALDSWAAKWVNGLWQDQYTAGCGTNPLVYCPWQGHTRAEGCVFYLRMLNDANYEPPQPTQQTFADVPLDVWYSKWVQAAYAAGLIPACQTSPALRICPNDPLSRAMAAYMMVQAKGLR